MLRALDLTTALRPLLHHDETLLFVQDAVGLYGGKAKLADYQNGQVYLTSHRVCYVDNEQPRDRAVAIELKDVERCEIFARFLKSSPKVALIPKAAKFGPVGIDSTANSAAREGHSNSSSLQNASRPSRPELKDATWVCPICSFSNPVPPNFDPSTANANTPLPACLACGIKPPLAHLNKAVINNLGGQQRAARGLRLDDITPPQAISSNASYAEDGVRCPRCTFQNHASMTACEICGTSLIIATKPVHERLSISGSPSRSSSPAITQGPGIPSLDQTEEVKLSFRAGGEKNFHERLKGALTQRKWLVQSAPPVPKSENETSSESSQPPQRSKLGIAGLENRGVEQRKTNELVIGNAFEDLAALMASAKEIIALAESLSSQSQNQSMDGNSSSSSTQSGNADPTLLLSQLNLTTTRDMLSTSKSSSTSLYFKELCRSIAEFLTDDRRSILKNAGGVMSLVDLWAVFNRARGGVELVSPADFATAADLFDKLSLPVRLRKFKSGLLVVQERNRADDKTIASLLSWLNLLKVNPLDENVMHEWRIWGCGVTAQETAERFGWSIGVASEELEMAEERGALCRESGIEGVRFWENHMGQSEVIDFKKRREDEGKKVVEENLRAAGLM
ncbi:MAG: hypothetical protein Q9162_004856 [Coniocarpon cinnabarinum]